MPHIAAIRASRTPPLPATGQCCLAEASELKTTTRNRCIAAIRAGRLNDGKGSKADFASHLESEVREPRSGVRSMSSLRIKIDTVRPHPTLPLVGCQLTSVVIASLPERHGAAPLLDP